METRQKTLTRGQEKDVEGDAEPEAGAPFPGDGSAGAGSGSPGPSRSPPTSGWAIQSAHARLADLLHAAASILDELTLGGAGAPGGVPGRRMGRVPAEKRAIPAQNFDVTSGGGDVTSAGDAAAGDDVTSAGGVTASGGHDVNRPGGQGAEVPRVTSAICGLTPGEAEFSGRCPPIPSDILPPQDASHTALGTLLSSRGDYIPALQQRLPSLQVFTAKGGDWAAFSRRFVANAETAGWSADIALRALPSALDDVALATFLLIPRRQRSTLQEALDRMALVYGPPSETRHRFASRRREADETPLAYQSALMALAQAAYPRMDDVGLDSIVLEKLLLLARELRIAIHVKDEANLSSLGAAHYLHTELLLQRDGQVAACAAARVDEVPDAQAFASQRAASWRGADRPRQGETRGRHGPPRALAGVTCYNCGQLGHLASGCPAPRRRASGHPPSSARPPAAPQDPQV
ncbi:uncharacterized protein LOC133348671 isoform X1 [Lethenteron reissneri]|uniref:uncharacterized protein LOC133348671 isoform X1 n=1 Tax=Lethenteron reissneri TaxID=7753 RepID=UPI002AB77393|nr:uncharacterized protein LOC133348671 isoform X1 [Lethenteron reissneri]